jgi:hypothetical protein
VQRDFLKYIAQEIKNDMLNNHKDELQQYLVNEKDRKYQFWERNALSVEIWTEKVFLQKLKYIHENPVRLGYTVILCSINIHLSNSIIQTSITGVFLLISEIEYICYLIRFRFVGSLAQPQPHTDNVVLRIDRLPTGAENEADVQNDANPTISGDINGYSYGPSWNPFKWKVSFQFGKVKSFSWLQPLPTITQKR